MAADVLIENHGSVAMLTPMTAERPRMGRRTCPSRTVATARVFYRLRASLFGATRRRDAARRFGRRVGAASFGPHRIPSNDKPTNRFRRVTVATQEEIRQSITRQHCISPQERFRPALAAPVGNIAQQRFPDQRSVEAAVQRRERASAPNGGDDARVHQQVLGNIQSVARTRRQDHASA